MKTKIIALAVLGTLAAGCALMMSEEEKAAKALAVMKASFKDNGQAKLDRLDQDEMQRQCSFYVGENKLPKDIAEKLEKSQQALIKYPAEGKFLGDWKEGEKIARSGVGKQFSDDQIGRASCRERV